jgi:hypothetical protein
MKRIINTNGVYSIIQEDRSEMPKIEIYAHSKAGGIHTAAWQEMVECVFHGLRDLRYDVKVATKISQISENVILIGAIGLTNEEIDLLPTTTVNYNSEHTSSQWIRDPAHPYRRVIEKYPCWDYSLDNTTRINELFGIDAQFVPLGYVPELTRIPKVDTDIDVLFFGSHVDRRTYITNQIRNLGLSFHHAFGVYGDERDSLIARSKVIINIHQMIPGAFEIRVSPMRSQTAKPSSPSATRASR